MNLGSIAVPSNFLGLQAVLRSMMPPDCVQRDAIAVSATPADGTGLYYEIIAGPRETEREAVRAWWAEFVTYATGRGGHEIIWRVRPELTTDREPETGKIGHTVHARFFIAKVDPPVVTW